MLADLHDYHFFIDSLYSFYSHNQLIFDSHLLDDVFFISFFKMVHLDVDPLIQSLPDFYSFTDRPAEFQIEIFCSLVLMAHFRFLSIKKWIVKLNNDKCLDALCGFDPLHIPQVASYYDFISRLWANDEKSHLLPLGLNAKPTGKKPKKIRNLRITLILLLEVLLIPIRILMSFLTLRTSFFPSLIKSLLSSLLEKVF